LSPLALWSVAGKRTDISVLILSTVSHGLVLYPLYGGGRWLRGLQALGLAAVLRAVSFVLSSGADRDKASPALNCFDRHRMVILSACSGVIASLLWLISSVFSYAAHSGAETSHLDWVRFLGGAISESLVQVRTQCRSDP
jgi:hypothetical protein